MINRRTLLKSAAAFASLLPAEQLSRLYAQTAPAPALKSLARADGKLIGVFGGAYLGAQPDRARLIANEFSAISDGNDLKFSDRLRPTPDTYDFTTGDWTLAWARRNNLIFRGHCLIWWNALPKWFNGYVTPSNAKRVLTDHITNVTKHYAGNVYSWDVVNEPIYHDGRPDGLRRKPWLDLIGPEYLDIAFHTAAAGDPKSRLILNECYIEHNTPDEIARRGALLGVATRLKTAGVPITGIGIQGHLRGNTPIDTKGLMDFSKKIRDLGLEVMITELDVDSVGVPAPMVDRVVAQKYSEFLGVMGPFVSFVSFQQLADEASAAKPTVGIASSPGLFDKNFQSKPSYQAVSQALAHMSPLRKG